MRNLFRKGYESRNLDCRRQRRNCLRHNIINVLISQRISVRYLQKCVSVIYGTHRIYDTLRSYASFCNMTNRICTPPPFNTHTHTHTRSRNITKCGTPRLSIYVLFNDDVSSQTRVEEFCVSFFLNVYLTTINKISQTAQRRISNYQQIMTWKRRGQKSSQLDLRNYHRICLEVEINHENPHSR